MSEPLGRRRWACAEGDIPGWSDDPEPVPTGTDDD